MKGFTYVLSGSGSVLWRAPPLSGVGGYTSPVPTTLIQIVEADFP